MTITEHGKVYENEINASLKTFKIDTKQLILTPKMRTIALT